MNVLTNQTALFNRRIADDLGGFDEALSGTDDWDFWIAPPIDLNSCRRARCSRAF